MKYIYALLILLSVAFPISAQFSIGGATAAQVINESGFKVFCLNGLSGAYAEYTTTANSTRFYKYSPAGRVEIPASEIINNGNIYRINNLEDGFGYISQEDGIDMTAIWIIDYSRYLPVIESISVEEFICDNSEGGCEDCEGREERVLIEKNEPELRYYKPDLSNGHVSRGKYTLEYTDIEWNETTAQFEEKTRSLETIYNEVNVISPLMDTHFVLKGDEIANNLGLTVEKESELFKAVRVDPHIIMKQITDTGEEVEPEQDENGYMSAPVHTKLYGVSNDPTTAYYTWKVYHGGNTEYEHYFSGKDFTYTFEKAGEWRIELEAASDNSRCVMTVEEKINIAESLLDVPNFFSPGDSPGVNDEFKVKHQSLVKFKCTIFNRWGNKVFQFDDPDKGWDGKYKGKLVNPGVYFYVIEATGSDGIKYKKGGDINIIRSK